MYRRYKVINPREPAKDEAGGILMAYSGITYVEAVSESEIWLKYIIGDFFKFTECEHLTVVLYNGTEVKHNACGFCADRIKFFGTGFAAEDIEYTISRYRPNCRDREDCIEAMQEGEPEYIITKRL